MDNQNDEIFLLLVCLIIVIMFGLLIKWLIS